MEEARLRKEEGEKEKEEEEAGRRAWREGRESSAVTLYLSRQK